MYMFSYGASTVSIAETSVFSLKEDGHVVLQLSILVVEFNCIQKQNAS